MGRVREFDTEAALASAAAAFRDHGYGGTSMRDLSMATGVAVGSLYTAFGGKDGLYRSALDRYGQDLRARAERLLSQGPAPAALRAFLLDHVAEVTADPGWPGCLVIGSAQERAGDDPAVHRRFGEALVGMRRLLAGAVRRGQAEGDIDPEVAPEQTAELLVLLVQGIRAAGVADKDARLLTAAVDLALSHL